MKSNNYNLESESFRIDGVPCKTVKYWHDAMGAERYHAFINGKKISVRVNIGLWGSAYQDMDSFPTIQSAKRESEKRLTGNTPG